MHRSHWTLECMPMHVKWMLSFRFPRPLRHIPRRTRDMAWVAEVSVSLHDEVAARATTPVVATMQKQEGWWWLTLRHAWSGGCTRARSGHRNVTPKFQTTDSTLACGRKSCWFFAVVLAIVDGFRLEPSSLTSLVWCPKSTPCLKWCCVHALKIQFRSYMQVFKVQFRRYHAVIGIECHSMEPPQVQSKRHNW